MTARIGLVLGAGGSVGGAFHAGVLAALAEGTGWDPRSAEVVVGTSAGSVTAAVLRVGLPATDLARRAEGRRLSDEGARVVTRAALGAPPAMPTWQPRERRAGGMAAPEALLAAARRPWAARPAAMAAAALPEGTIPTEPIAAALDSAFAGRWPDQTLWICAVRLGDGALVVFGREGAPSAHVGQAVAASCAVPGYFRPPVIGGQRYVDGGVRSLTSLDLLAGKGLDLIVVSSPMSQAGRFSRPAPDRLIRQASRLQLEREAARVRRGGTPVVAFQPTAEDQRVMGLNAMDQSRRAAVARQVRASTLERLQRDDLRQRLAPLQDR